MIDLAFDGGAAGWALACGCAALGLAAWRLEPRVPVRLRLLRCATSG